jgi:hypothetical protein
MAMNMDALLRIKADVQGGNKIVELNRGLRSVEGAAKGVSGAMRGLTGAAGGLSGALGALAPLASVAGLVGLAKGALDAGDKMYDLAQSTGVSVEALARFKKAAATSGTDIDAVAKGLVKLSRGLVETATTGKGKAAEALRYLGISATDASGNLKKADQVTLEIANKFKALPDGAIKTATAVNLFGRAGADLVPLLNLGGDAIDKLSVKLTTAFAEKADAYNDKLAALSGKVGALGADLLILLLPALDKITDAVSAAITAFNNLPAPVKNFAVAGAAVAIAWGPAAALVRGAIGIFVAAGAAAAGATPKVIALGNAMAALAGRLAILAAAIRLVNGIGASVANIGEIGALNRRQAAGGAAAQFKGADRATVAAAKQTAVATLKQIAAERGRQNKIWNAVNPLGIQDRKERELLLQKREKAARAIAGLDPNKYREAAAITGGSDIEALKAAMDDGGGAGKGKKKGTDKAAAEAKRLAAEQAKQLLDSQKQLAISQAELRITAATNALDKTAAEYALQKLRIEQDFAVKLADTKQLKDGQVRQEIISNLEAIKRNELEKARIGYLEQQTRELLRQAGIDNPDFGKKPTGIDWKDATQFKPRGENQATLDEEYNKINQRLQEMANPANQIIGAANAIGDAFANSFQGVISGAMTAKQALQNFFQDIASYFTKMATQMIADAIRMMAIKFLGNLLSSALGGFAGGGVGANFSSAGAGATGISWGNAVQYTPSFAGGGYTGGKARAGGLDGKGGFMALLHPQETVVDHFGANRAAMAGNSSSSGSPFAENLATLNASSTVTRERAIESAQMNRLSNPAPMMVSYQSEVINSVSYVSEDQFQKGLRDTANRARMQTLSDLKNKPATRSQVGMR